MATKPPAGDGMWTIDGVAEHLDVSREVVRRWIIRGELRAYKYGPKLIRIDPADVRRMARPIGAQKSAAPAAAPPAPPAARRTPTPARTSPTPAASLPAYATPAPRGVPRAIGGGAR